MTIIHRICIAAALLLSGAAGAAAQTTDRNKHDDVARTIVACGEPVRNYVFPDVLKTRILAYREATLWFMGGDKGWFFRGWGNSVTDVPVLNRDEVDKLLPCFAKVTLPSLPESSPGLAAKPADGDGVSTEFSGFFALVLCSLGALLYLVPWVVACRRHVDAQAGIIVLNLLLGWTVLGWVGALIWAVHAETESQAKLRGAVVTRAS
jgi:hypothetical protein